MQNGRDDFLFSSEASQIPLLRLLGTPEKDKKHLLCDGGHDVFFRMDVTRDMPNWLDKYLGPANLRR